MEPINESEEDTVTLTLEDGTELECTVAAIYPAKGKRYIALLPPEDAQTEEGEVYLYGYEETENGVPNLLYIESDEEYEIAADAFDELLDSEEYDELFGEDDF